METEVEDLNGSRKKTVVISLATLGAIAAGGEGYRRRRQDNSSSEWARKALVLIAVLATISALGTLGVKKRRARGASPESLNSDSGDTTVESIVPAGTTGGTR